MCVQCGTAPTYARGLCRRHYDRQRPSRRATVAGTQPGGSWREPPDPVVVLRVAAGEHLATHPAARRELVELLTRRGYSAKDIACRVGIAQRTVVRIRMQLRDLSTSVTSETYRHHVPGMTKT